MSKIQWCDEVWNCVVGCSRVSAGCDNCYAIGIAHRAMQPAHEGLTKMRPKDASRPGVDWTGAVRCLPERLGKPLHWRKPRRVFVNSMSDMFHEQVPSDFLAEVFARMALAHQHTFIVLTKRPGRMREVFRDELDEAVSIAVGEAIKRGDAEPLPGWRNYSQTHHHSTTGVYLGRDDWWEGPVPWPLPNVILGVSVEDQATADERIPILLDTPAAIRAVSYEPALGPVDFSPWIHTPPGAWIDVDGETVYDCSPGDIGWVIVGGESGPGARPFAIEWAQAVVDLCKAATVPVFFKQGGASNACEHDRKGGCLACMPEDLRIREHPNVT